MKPRSLLLLSGGFVVAAFYFYLWTLYAASASPAECRGVLALFAEVPQCRWPRIPHYGFKLSLVFMLSSLLWALIAGRKRGS